jgi:hypothetical protein
MDYDTTVTTRITEETKEQIEKYAEDNGLSKAGAQRQLLYKGMRVEGVDPREDDTVRGRAGQGGNLFDVIQILLLMTILGFLVVLTMGVM